MVRNHLETTIWIDFVHYLRNYRQIMTSLDIVYPKIQVLVFGTIAITFQNVSLSSVIIGIIFHI